MDSSADVPVEAHSQSAPAMLASSMFDLELNLQKQTGTQGTWRTGIQNLDGRLPSQLWTSGKVIGIASVGGNETLSANIIASHLLSLAHQATTGPSSTSEPSAFILSPPSTPVISSTHDLLTSRANNTTTTANPPPEPLNLLSTVSLLQYLDFPGLTESIAEVSQRLYSSTSSSSIHPKSSDRTILYLTPLTPLLTSLARRCGPTQTNALLSNFLRQLTHLSRSHPSLLVLLDLELEISRPTTASTSTSTSSTRYYPPDALDCAFSKATGAVRRLCPTGTVGRTLEQGLDCIVALWDQDWDRRKGKRIVEVVKDRTGRSFGSWCIWD